MCWNKYVGEWKNEQRRNSLNLYEKIIDDNKGHEIFILKIQEIKEMNMGILVHWIVRYDIISSKERNIIRAGRIQ